MWGFNTLKDVLDIVIIPLALFALGAWLPRQLEGQRRRAFVRLIRRELSEMIPDPPKRQEHGRWHLHLRKRFLHEDIFGKPSDNRDFILSLPPDLAYNIAQLWAQFDKAEKAAQDSELFEYGHRWCDYLQGLCEFFDKKKDGPSYVEICKPWQELIAAYSRSLE